MVLGTLTMVKKKKKIGQGKENVKIFLKENPALRDELEQKIREHYGFYRKNKR